ncbi:hypothetical protein [Winogradskyella ursingii]|uniref:hypothetical protein n=1 Tax=Winogradskyella ursingii TaxID=2686079 RepID=UPI003742B8E6
MVKSKNKLQGIFDDCPFALAKKAESYFVILSAIPDTQLVKETIQKTYPDDEYHIIKDCIYLYCANGYGKSKFNLNYFEKKLKVKATARNYKTTVKLLSLTDNK